MALASVWSASVHFGSPTFLMFRYIVSATGLLKCCGHAEPSTRVPVSSTPAIIAAPLAIVSPISHICLMCG